MTNQVIERNYQGDLKITITVTPSGWFEVLTTSNGGATSRQFTTLDNAKRFVNDTLLTAANN